MIILIDDFNRIIIYQIRHAVLITIEESWNHRDRPN